MRKKSFLAKNYFKGVACKGACTSFAHVMEDKLISIGSQKLLNGDFENAMWAFNTAVLLYPSCSPGLWQRGLCCYFMGKFEEGMKQFEADMNVNGGDIEEVIWNFICKCGQIGFIKAFKTGFLPLKSAINESLPAPMSEVLSLFKGEITPNHVISSARNEDGSVKYSYNNTNALAYAHYYVGIYHQLKGDHVSSGIHLEKACQYNTDDYMGGIMRLHYRLWNRECTGFKAMAPRFKMGNSESSRIIYGGWQLSSGHGSTNGSCTMKLLANILDSISYGVTSFDCGDIYTGVEEVFGNMINAYTTEAGGSREDISIHTKLVPDLVVIQEGGVTEAYVRAIVQRSLNRMNTSYLDLVQFHWWDISCQGYVQALRYLNRLREEGVVKQIGLTNFGLAQTKEILDSNIPIVSTQVQFSVLDRRPVSSGLAHLCQQRQVSIIAYGVLAGGFLTDKWIGTPEPTQMANRSLVKYHLIIKEFGGWDKYQELLKVLRSIADNHSPLTAKLPNGKQVHMDRVTVAMIAIAYVLHQPGVDGVILGSLDACRSMESIMAASFIVLTSDDIHAIDQIASCEAPHGLTGDVYQLERISNGCHGTIMKYNLNNINKGPHLDELCRRYLEALFMAYPVEGTRSGYYNNTFDNATMSCPSIGSGFTSLSEHIRLFALRTVTCDHQLDIASEKDIKKYLVKLTNLTKEASSIDKGSLTEDQLADLEIILSQLHLEILKWQEVKHYEKDPSVYLPFDGINYLLPTWGGSSAGSYPQHSSDCEYYSHPGTVHIPPSFKLMAILSRIQQIPQLLSNGKNNLTQPFKPFVVTAISFCESFVKFLKVEFETLVRQISSFSEEPERLDELVNDILFASDIACHSILDFKSFLEEELLDKASNKSVAIGKEVYDRLLLYGQMIDEDSSKLLQMGQSRFEQVKKELAELASKIIPGKTWQEITEEVIRCSSYHPPSTDLLQSYMREIELSRQHMQRLDLMPPLPDDERVVGIYTPSCLWPFTPFGDFLNPSPFANMYNGRGTSSKSHTGCLMLHPVHTRGLSMEDEEKVLRSHDYSWIKVIAPHECYPGHHVQALLAQAHPRLIRKYHESAYFYEGWGLYCEQLAYEVGFFETETPMKYKPRHDNSSITFPPTKVSVPELTRLTQLRLQLWRCARVILDIQLHCGGLKLDECREFLCKEVMFDPQSAAGEVMMYASRPTYAPCYIIGMIKILALREKEKQQCKIEGKPFNLKTFNNKILRNGSLPFVLVERLMNL